MPGEIDGPGTAAKLRYRRFYDDITKRLAASGMGDASFFLNYGYVSLGDGDESALAVEDTAFNANSIRLAYELVGSTDLTGRDALDIGCGRGGTAVLLADQFGAQVSGVDLSPEAVAFCRETHAAPNVSFMVGDAEHLPFEDDSFDAVSNVESSHTYPDMRAFLSEVAQSSPLRRLVPAYRSLADSALDGGARHTVGPRFHRLGRPGNHRERARVM